MSTASLTASTTDNLDTTIELPIVTRHSVVDAAYKAAYALRAANRKKKPTLADKRGCGDWLQRRLAELTLNPDQSLNVPDFCHLLDLNNVRHDHWNRTTPGWQGRLRMTGRLSLQRQVAEHGVLHTVNGDVHPPKAWCDRINGSRKS